MNRTAWPTSLLVAAAMIVTACSGDDDAAPTTSTTATTVAPSTTARSTTTTTTQVVTTTSIISVTTIPDVPRMPLTGDPIEDESAIPDRPALVVKISNAPTSVIPQAGLNEADIVLEAIINDSVTRLATVFHSQDSDPVGPIRSGRAQDVNLLLSLNRPLFAWSGGNPAVTRAIRDSDLVDLSFQRTTGYYRRSGRRGPNDLYSSTEVLWGHTPDDAQVPPQVFPYLREGEQLTGSPATDLEIKLDSIRARWVYDEASQRYYRRQNGVEHNTETSTGVEQVWATNVVVMMADYGRNRFDGNPDAQVLGSNPVFIFTGGTVRSGTWLRFAAEDPFSFFDTVEDLNPLGLRPGRTWVEIPRNLDDVLTWSE